MERVEITAELRTIIGKHVKELRRQGWVPGVIYGHGFEAQAVQFETRPLRRVLSQVSGSQLIGINVAEQDEPAMALVRGVQRNPLTGELLHVDFYRVRMTERLTAEIPLVLTGESPLITQKEGILLTGVSAIEVECLPGDLVDSIHVDISGLVKLDTSIHVRDLIVPAGIEVLTEADEMVARVVPLAAEAEEDLAPVAEVAEVEVIGRAVKEEVVEEE
jgi:large subunit ribosomal protein L25